MCCFRNIQGCYLMQFYQLATICFVTSRKKMQSTLICSLDCDANNVFVWMGAVFPLSPKGRGDDYPSLEVRVGYDFTLSPLGLRYPQKNERHDEV